MLNELFLFLLYFQNEMDSVEVDQSVLICQPMAKNITSNLHIFNILIYIIITFFISLQIYLTVKKLDYYAKLCCT